jgi:hypothetical protein
VERWIAFNFFSRLNTADLLLISTAHVVQSARFLIGAFNSILQERFECLNAAFDLLNVLQRFFEIIYCSGTKLRASEPL